MNDRLIEEADDLSMTNGGPEAFMLFLIYESIKTLFISAVLLKCKIIGKPKPKVKYFYTIHFYKNTILWIS
jgi:hypothetical protein